jgi:hypothetical protein
MGTVIYRIVPQSKSSFGVEIFGPGDRHYGAYGFMTEAAAQAWVNEKRRAAKADQKWEQIPFNISPVDGRIKT